MIARKRHQVWTAVAVDEAKRDVKIRLDKAAQENEPRKRLKECLCIIVEDQKSGSSSGYLNVFIAIVSALLHHARYGGLKEAQIEQLRTLGKKILALYGVAETSGRLSFMHSYLYGAVGQVKWVEGDVLSATWEQYMAARSATVGFPVQSAFHKFAAANRFMRLGHLQLALTNMHEAIKSGLEPGEVARARIAGIKAMRLMGHFDHAIALAQSHLQNTELVASNAGFELEIKWEIACCHASTSGNISELVQLTKRDATHFHFAYLSESILWALAHSSIKWIEKTPDIGAVKKISGRSSPAAKILTTIIETLQQSYVVEMPLQRKLDKLGNCIALIPKVIGIDQELLCWLAITRAIFRLRMGDSTLVELCLSEYEVLSLRVCRQTDALLLANDMIDGDWRQNASPILAIA